MRSAIESNPDAAWEGRLALAAALLGSGRAKEATVALGTLAAGLEPLARDDFMNRQLLDLAQAIYVQALLTSGDLNQARREAERLTPVLRRGLLPATIVRKVLSSVN